MCLRASRGLIRLCPQVPGGPPVTGGPSANGLCCLLENPALPVRNVHIIPRIIVCIEVTTAVILPHTELIKIKIKIKFTSLSLLAMTFAAIDHCHSYATVTKAPIPIVTGMACDVIVGRPRTGLRSHAYAATCPVIGN